MDNALEVIAAALALPVIEAELKKLKNPASMGAGTVEGSVRQNLNLQRTPLEARRNELRRIVFGEEE